MTMLICPMIMSFDFEDDVYKFIKIFFLMSFVIFSLDTLLMFKTAFYNDQEVLIDNEDEIFKEMIKSHLVLKIVGVLCVILPMVTSINHS